MTTKTMHEKLTDRAASAIEDVFSDMTVPAKQTLESLEWLREEVGVRIQSVEQMIAHPMVESCGEGA